MACAACAVQLSSHTSQFINLERGHTPPKTRDASLHEDMTASRLSSGFAEAGALYIMMIIPLQHIARDGCLQGQRQAGGNKDLMSAYALADGQEFL